MEDRRALKARLAVWVLRLEPARSVEVFLAAYIITHQPLAHPLAGGHATDPPHGLDAVLHRARAGDDKVHQRQPALVRCLR
jgi:hypothetical protein